MLLDVLEINKRVENNPSDFVSECEAEYDARVNDAARQIASGAKDNCVVLLSGPSGSGKTTTAKKLEERVEQLGIITHTISLDDYFNTLDPKTAPRTPEGKIDYESPNCLDIELLDDHITKIIRREKICVPKFNFQTQSRKESSVPLKLNENEIVIFEGIHALNDEITGAAGNHGVKLYISARSNFTLNDSVCFKGTWSRLIRRIVRDENFRATRPEFTMGIWDTIRRGEKLHISPFKDRADIIINSTHSYEVCALKKHIQSLISCVPEGTPRHDELCLMLKNLSLFANLPDSFVPPDSLLREFIGGGSFNY